MAHKAAKKVWFITGAGRGMGVDFVKAALAAGYAVVATGRDTDAVAKAVGKSEGQLIVKLDVTNRADAEAAHGGAAEVVAGTERPARRRRGEARAGAGRDRQRGAAAAPLHRRRRCHRPR